jgi:hypothetical protein
VQKTLFNVALLAVGLLVESSFAVMAHAAELASSMRGLHLEAVFLHLEDFGVAVVALVARVGVALSDKGDLAHGVFVLDGLAGRNSHGASDKCNSDKNGQEYRNLFHCFTPFRLDVSMRIRWITSSDNRNYVKNYNLKMRALSREKCPWSGGRDSYGAGLARKAVKIC